MPNYSTKKPTVKKLIQVHCAPNPQDRSKYQCPVCNGWNLSVSKHNDAYNCFSGCDAKKIAKTLYKMEDKNTIKDTVYRKGFSSYYYNKEDGSKGIKVTKKYLPAGKKQIRQYTCNEGRWVAGYKHCTRNEVSIYNWNGCKDSDNILLVEGEGCAETAKENGFYATTIVGGSSVGGDTPLYPLALKQLLSFKKITLCPDRDEPGIKFMEKIASQLRGKVEIEWLYLYPESQSWQNIPEDNGYDIEDYFKGGNDPHIPSDWYRPDTPEKSDSKKLEVVDINKLKTFASQKQVLAEIIGDRIKLNLLTNDIELDGKNKSANDLPISYENILANFPSLFGCEIACSTDKFSSLASVIAEENAYDPMLDYYESLPHSDYNLREVAVKYFGCEPDSIYCEMVERWLISAVARTYEPGCQADSALILFEAIGGIGKSRWFQHLLPDKSWYCANMGDINNKDERIKLHQYKLIEWGELDGLFGMRASALVKAFLSCDTDNIRMPYARSSRKLRRRSILCGTTNKKELIMDKSGVRRFWVVPVTLTSVPLNMLRSERDAIWGAAVQKYKAGEKWWLENNESIEQHRKSLDEFIHKPEYQEDVEVFIENLAPRQQFTVEEIVKTLNIPDLQVRKFQQALKRILEDLGWEQRYKKIEGKTARVYQRHTKENSVSQVCHPVTPITTTTTTLDTVDTLYSHGENLDCKKNLIDNDISDSNILQSDSKLQITNNSIVNDAQNSVSSVSGDKTQSQQGSHLDTEMTHQKDVCHSFTNHNSNLKPGQAIVCNDNGTPCEGIYCGFQKDGEYVGDENCVVLLKGWNELFVVRCDYITILNKKND